MAVKQRIEELTKNKYNELYYRPGNQISGKFIKNIKDMLKKCNVPVDPLGDGYDLNLEEAVMEFQKRNNMTMTGILDNVTWQTMIMYSRRHPDIIPQEANKKEEPEEQESKLRHYNSYFNTENYKQHRQNMKDIKIVFGNNSITKVIKNVFMRSVSVEVDTSGNPVSEVYEFIAEDIYESDEINDIIKINEKSISSNSRVKNKNEIVNRNGSVSLY